VGENSIGIRLAWRSFQAVINHSAILKHLGVSRAPPCGLFLGSVPTLILHFAAVEAHKYTVNNQAFHRHKAAQFAA
jgi:hypothetical protein